jgi:Domain of unknown function (DUF4279)
MAISKYSFLVGLYIYGDRLDPVAITKIIGVKPTRSHKLGEGSTTSTGKKVVKKTGLWALVSDSDSSKLADHIDQLADRLKTISGKQLVLSGLPDVEELYFDIFVCGSGDRDGEEAEFGLAPNHISLLSEIGLEVKFSVSSFAG